MVCKSGHDSAVFLVSLFLSLLTFDYSHHGANLIFPLCISAGLVAGSSHQNASTAMLWLYGYSSTSPGGLGASACSFGRLPRPCEQGLAH